MRLRSALLVPAREPSLAEFRTFHGMLPRPGVAKRCVAALQSTIVFAPVSYTDADFVEDSPYEVKRLTVMTYWLLVLASLTGLSTLLGCTDVVDAREVDALPPHALHPSEAMMAYVRRRTVEEMRVCRRFEFDFRLGGLRVVMLHFRGASGRLHLVEVYDSRLPAPVRWLFETAKALVAGLVAPRPARGIINKCR
jgi:hypothetical protein